MKGREERILGECAECALNLTWLHSRTGCLRRAVRLLSYVWTLLVECGTEFALKFDLAGGTRVATALVQLQQRQLSRAVVCLCVCAYQGSLRRVQRCKVHCNVQHPGPASACGCAGSTGGAGSTEAPDLFESSATSSLSRPGTGPTGRTPEEPTLGSVSTIPNNNFRY